MIVIETVIIELLLFTSQENMAYSLGLCNIEKKKKNTLRMAYFSGF